MPLLVAATGLAGGLLGEALRQAPHIRVQTLWQWRQVRLLPRKARSCTQYAKRLGSQQDSHEPGRQPATPARLRRQLHAFQMRAGAGDGPRERTLRNVLGVHGSIGIEPEHCMLWGSHLFYSVGLSHPHNIISYRLRYRSRTRGCSGGYRTSSRGFTVERNPGAG